MQGNNVNGQVQVNPNMQQPVGGVSNTNHINNISAVAANNRQMNMNMNNNMGNPNMPNNQMNSGMGYGGYVEPPKKKSSTGTFLIIFLILAAAAVLGYFAGQWVYNLTH